MSFTKRMVAREQRIVSANPSGRGGTSSNARPPEKGWRHSYKMSIRATGPDRKGKNLDSWASDTIDGTGSRGVGRSAQGSADPSRMSVSQAQGALRTMGAGAHGTAGQIRERYAAAAVVGGATAPPLQGAWGRRAAQQSNQPAWGNTGGEGLGAAGGEVGGAGGAGGRAGVLGAASAASTIERQAGGQRDPKG